MHISALNFILLISSKFPISVQIAFEKPTSKVERRRRLKKYQVDSTDEDSSFKPAVKRNAPSIFDSGSDDDDNVPISVALAKKDSDKVADEVEPPNVEAKDKTRKKSSDARKRKSSAISQDTASPMYISWFLLRHLSFSVICTAH